MRRRSTTDGNGSTQTSASGFPLSGAAGPSQSGLLADGPAQNGSSSGPAERMGSRFAISNWRVRWRLVAIIAVPTVTALILGTFQIIGAVGNYSSFKRVQNLANANALVVRAAGALANERDDTAGYVASGKLPALRAVVTKDQAATDAIIAQLKPQALAIKNGSGYRAQTILDLNNGVLAGIRDLTNIRQAETGTKSPALSVIQTYDQRLLQPFIAFSDDIAAGTSNAALQSDVSVLNALLRMEDDVSLQRAYLYQALENSPPVLTPVALGYLNQAVSQQQADDGQFSTVASESEQQTLNNTVAGPGVDEARSAEKLAITTAGTAKLQIGAQQTCGSDTQAQCWDLTQTSELTQMQQVSSGLVDQITAQANSLERSALRQAIIVSVATLVLLLLVLLITTFVARSMIRPLRKLRADALEVAGSKLPAMVRRLSESEGGDASVEIEPIGVNSSDEIGEVARAFDQVHREAVRLAADEAMLRGNLNAMFVNLSRRSQSLIERQLSLIDSLEQSEQDSDRLASLFRLDHLATRMRRNSENLLVLAGHEAASRRWSQPVALVDVLRAAISEIDQYERVVLNVQPGIQVVGQAVNDVVHLVAEVVENATTFSPEDTQVYVTGQPLTSGGVLLDITDNGVGITEQEMAHANWRLDNPPVVDVAVSRRMGLFVVGRLAARHGVRVRLRHAQSGGLTALIWLPESVAAPESAQPLGRLRKFEADDYGPAPSLSAPSTVTAPAGLTGAAATASRILRLGGTSGGNGASGGNGTHGGRNGNGNGKGSSVPFGGVPGANGQIGSPGPDTAMDAPGAALPVRQPGTNPLGPAGGSSFGDDVFGGGGLDGGDFATTRMPALGGDGGAAAMAAIIVPNAPTGPGNSPGGSDGSQVTIPAQAAGAPQDLRLPIFDSLESDWFRRSGKPAGPKVGTATAIAVPKAAQPSWNSPADEGYRAARSAASPAAGENTTAGLPQRVPRANLVPGSVGGQETESAPPVRSADTIRSRMASFQRGVREARSAAPQNEER